MRRMHFMMITGILALSIIILASGCRQPVCGNQILEEGETSATCCADAGCPGSEECINNTCISPECGECGYYDEDAHECVDYECCEDDDCSADEECSDHECNELLCRDCSYIDDHECIDIECCDDEDCDDNDDSTMDMCKFPGTKSAECSYTELEVCDDDSDCDDNDDSTEDICIDGEPNECIHFSITDCNDDDGYCPSDCDYTEDNDCESNVLDCGTDEDCFIDALSNCTLAQLTLDMDVDNSTAEMDIIVLAEILEWDDSNEICEIAFEFDSIVLEYTDSYRNTLGDDPYNHTEDEIDDLEEDDNDDLDDKEGDAGECDIDESDLDDVQDIIDDWERDDFDVEDFDSYDCSGDFFD
ncbi:hypothetical protein GF345_00815 [Candidatus Woesearchaeota archaeon]|nr:hypothetical protein [Candidatus Woesearchaeota archaeon]